MSIKEVGSTFFSLPYDRDGYGSLERLIGRESELPDRDTDQNRDNRSHTRSHDSTLWNQQSSTVNNSFDDDRFKTNRNRINRNDATSNDLIDFENENSDNYRSCNNLDPSPSDFINYNNDIQSSSIDNLRTNTCSNYFNSNQRSVDIRNRRNYSSHDEDYQQYITHEASERITQSLPNTCDFNDRSVCGSNGYGSGGEKMSASDTTLTYCVHGKPGAGCCATLLNQPAAPAINISVDEHCHIKERDTGINKKARRQIIIVSSLCLFFMIAEAIGGYLSGSLAIATDAAHLLTDFAGFMISLFALYVAARKPSRIMPFGWHRAEVIGAMISVLTIWLVTGILVYLAVQRIIDKDFEIDATVMLITSAIGVVVNIIMALTLHQHSHAHTACSHQSASSTAHTDEDGSNEKQNINVRAAFIHIIGDLLQSVGVFIAATIIYYKPEYVIVDPICTFLFSVLVLATTFNIMRDALLVLMEGIPRDVDFNDVLSTLLAIDGVIRVHNLRIWALSLDKTALSAHLAIAPSADCTEILKAASKEIHKKYNFFEMTLQIEYFHQNMETCAQCQVKRQMKEEIENDCNCK